MAAKNAFPRPLAGAAVAVALFFAALPSAAEALRLDGTVLSKSASAKSFRLTTKSGRVNVRVNSRTKFVRIAGGFGGLRKGARIQVDGVFAGSGVLARKVAGAGGRTRGDGGGGGGGEDEDEDDEEDGDEEGGDEGGGDEAGGGDGEGGEGPEDADPEE
jgi:hypothetical protein